MAICPPLFIPCCHLKLRRRARSGSETGWDLRCGATRRRLRYRATPELVALFRELPKPMTRRALRQSRRALARATGAGWGRVAC